MTKLTPRQAQILALIQETISTNGFPPTRAEIAAQMGFRSVNAAEEHLRALARKGVIILTPGTSRGIRLCNEQSAHISVTSDLSSPDSASSQPLTLPLVGRVAAGSPILAQEHIDTMYQVDPSLFTGKPDYLLKVRGMSMRDAGILDGDLLAIRKTQQARNGQIVVARLDDEVTVKRYQQQGSKISLLPENPDFSPILVDPKTEDFVLEGCAVGLLRSWD